MTDDMKVFEWSHGPAGITSQIVNKGTPYEGLDCLAKFASVLFDLVLGSAQQYGMIHSVGYIYHLQTTFFWQPRDFRTVKNRRRADYVMKESVREAIPRPLAAAFLRPVKVPVEGSLLALEDEVLCLSTQWRDFRTVTQSASPIRGVGGRIAAWNELPLDNEPEGLLTEFF